MFNWAVIKPISRTLFKELFATLLILFIISFSVFSLIYISPNEDMLHEYILMISEEMGAVSEMDSESTPSYLSTFLTWFTAVVTGNFGLSLSTGLPALDQSVSFLGNSLQLIVYTLLLSLVAGSAFTYLLVNHSHGLVQKIVSLILVSLSHLPIFWLAYFAIYLAGVMFDFFPLNNFGDNEDIELLLPVLLLAIGSGLIVEIAHQLKQEISRVLREDYILSARARGASVFKHLLKEAIAFPLLTLLSNRIAYLFGATIIIEQIFNFPGIGKLLWQSTQDRDLPLLLAAVVITVLVIRIFQFFMRAWYILINPRASHE